MVKTDWVRTRRKDLIIKYSAKKNKSQRELIDEVLEWYDDAQRNAFKAVDKALNIKKNNRYVK